MTLPSQLSRRCLLYFLGFLILVLFAVTLFGERGALHLWRLRGEKTKLDEENYRLQKENEVLRRRISKLRNDDSYLEKLAREELNLVRPGEVIYRFPTSQPKKSRAGAFTVPPYESRPSAAQKERR